MEGERSGVECFCLTGKNLRVYGENTAMRPECGAVCELYDCSAQRSWRHLDTMQFETIPPERGGLKLRRMFSSLFFHNSYSSHLWSHMTKLNLTTGPDFKTSSPLSFPTNLNNILLKYKKLPQKMEQQFLMTI